MKHLFVAILCLVALSGCGSQEETKVYVNDGDDLLYVVNRTQGLEGEMIAIEYWKTLTIDTPVAYVETNDETIVFSLDTVAFVIDR